MVQPSCVQGFDTSSECFVPHTSSNHQPWLNVTGSEPNVPGGVFQLYNIVEDPEERHDHVNDTSVSGILAELKVWSITKETMRINGDCENELEVDCLAIFFTSLK